MVGIIKISVENSSIIYELYGHTELRVQDEHGDYFFNYGLFDFNAPGFVYRFVKGETDYLCGAIPATYALSGYDGRRVVEQQLNLSQTQAQQVRDLLVENARPENATYRYKFVSDNCATRPAALIEKAVGQVDYHYPYEAQTFRALINYCTRAHAWLTFGCDLALGSPTDRLATPHEMLFLPSYLRDAFSKAEIVDAQGNRRPLVSQTSVIEAEAEEIEPDLWDTLTPLRLSWLLFLLTMLLSAWGWRTHHALKGLDVLLFAVAGLAGMAMSDDSNFLIRLSISFYKCLLPSATIAWRRAE